MGRIRGCSIVMVVCAKTAMISGVLRMGGGGRCMQRRCSLVSSPIASMFQLMQEVRKFKFTADLPVSEATTVGLAVSRDQRPRPAPLASPSKEF